LLHSGLTGHEEETLLLVRLFHLIFEQRLISNDWRVGGMLRVARQLTPIELVVSESVLKGPRRTCHQLRSYLTRAMAASPMTDAES
jgi:hypothetical protein